MIKRIHNVKNVGAMAIFFVYKNGSLIAHTHIVKPEMVKSATEFFLSKQALPGQMIILKEGEWENFILNKGLPYKIFNIVKNIFKEKTNGTVKHRSYRRRIAV